MLIPNVVQLSTKRYFKKKSVFLQHVAAAPSYTNKICYPLLIDRDRF